MAVGLADNRDEVANSPYLTQVGDCMPWTRRDQPSKRGGPLAVAAVCAGFRAMPTLSPLELSTPDRGQTVVCK
jgi:hypothetical protein